MIWLFLRGTMWTMFASIRPNKRVDHFGDDVRMCTLFAAHRLSGTALALAVIRSI